MNTRSPGWVGPARRRRALAGVVAALAALALLAAGSASAATVSGPASAKAGQVVALSGAGFTPGDIVTCSVPVPKVPDTPDGQYTEVLSPIGKATVNPDGSFTMFVDMPYSAGYEIGRKTFVCTDQHSVSDSAQVKFETSFTVDVHSPFTGDDQANGLMVNFFGQSPFKSQDSTPPADHGGIISGNLRVPIGPGGTAADGIFPTWLNDGAVVVGYQSPSPGVDNGFACKILGNVCAPVNPGGLGGGNTFIDAVNDKNQIAGSSVISGGSASHAMACTLDTSFHCQIGPFDMGTLGGSYSSASALNVHDLIVGQSNTAGGQYHAFSCLRNVGACDGGMQDLGTLGGTTSQAYAVSDADSIAGTAQTGTGNTHAFLKLSGQPMKNLGTLAGNTQSYAYGVNDQNEVVGDPPFIWSNNVMFNLENLLPPGWNLTVVNGINVFGQIAAEGHQTGGDKALILDPKLLIGDVVITNSGFTPQNVTVQEGGVVQFVNNGTQSHNVTDGSHSGLFANHTLVQNRGASVVFPNAGTFPVTDTLHDFTVGVRVPMSAAPASGHTSTVFQIGWSPYNPPANHVYDVQIKRPGATTFVSFMHGVTKGLARFVPDAGPGNYQFQARIRNTSNGNASGWSPTLTIPVS